MLFARKRPQVSPYPAEEWEPVLRCSICTGEKTACMMNRKTGQIRELVLIRSDRDLAQFRKEYGVTQEHIRTIY